MAKKIIIIMPYFGKWPFWIELFLESCRRNSTVDWVFFSDCGKLESFPDNVEYHNISFDEYKRVVSDSLQIEFNPDSSYKICDIRPAFGYIHLSVIEGYDFWGFGDLDLIYGDLRAVYNEELLENNDLVSNHATRVSGHLCLIKNNEKMRNLFKKIPQWKDKFSDKKHQAVDEKAFSKIFVKHKNLPAWLRKPLTNMLYPLSRRTSFVERFTTPDGCIAWKDGSYRFPEAWFWSLEGLSNSFEEEAKVPYFHFAVWKKSTWSSNEITSIIPYDKSKIYRFNAHGIDALESANG